MTQQMNSYVKFGEEYTSHSLNRKLAGVLMPGVYWGFEVRPGGGMALCVGHSEDREDSVAVVERGGYSLTVCMSGEVVLDNVAPGEWHVVIEALYELNQETWQRILLTTAPADHHVPLAVISIPAGATEITAEMIDASVRQEANPVALTAFLASHFAELTRVGLDNAIRLTNLENWAREQGYEPNKLYLEVSRVS